MKEVGKAVGDRVVVQKARDYAEFKRELCDKYENAVAWPWRCQMVTL